MGFGKTVSVTTAIEKLFRAGEIKKLLVVSTLLVSRETWPAEIENWSHTSYLKFSLLLGDGATRLEAAKGNEQIHIINQENFVWLAMTAGRKWPYDMVVFDDTKGFKSAKRKNSPSKAVCKHSGDCAIFEHEKTWHCTKQETCQEYFHPEYGEECVIACDEREPVKANLKACSTLCQRFESPPSRHTRFGALCALRAQIKRIVHLTGTPSSKGLLDLWPMLYTMDNGLSLERTYTQYKNKYFNKSHNGFSWELKPGAEAQIHKAIQHLCISIESEAKLPPRHDIDYAVKLPADAAEMYDEFEKELVLEVADSEIVAANNGVLAGKLLQVCGGAVYTGEGDEWIVLHDEKLKALDNIMKKHPGEPLLIGYNFKHELARLKKKYPQGVDIRDRKDAVHAWNAGEIPLMFAHPDSAGHGLNLQHGPGRVLIWFGLNWSLNLNKQLNKRLHRPGQKREVYIYYIIAKGRADTDVMEGVAKYDYTQNQLLEAVKRRASSSSDTSQRSGKHSLL